MFASKTRPSVAPYKTTIYDNGVIQCDCPAFRECWHIKTVRDREPIGRTEWAKLSQLDRAMIYNLLEEGNSSGARECALNLFPSMSVEETESLIDEILENCSFDDEGDGA